MASSAWSNDLTTTLILPTGATPPDQRIVLDGASDTILVYNSVGALIASVAATAGNDGLGNNYPAGISATGGIVSQSIILLYNGTPAAGNLVVSLANAAGSDSFGNNYAAGFNFYNGSATTYAQTLAGAVTIGPIAGSNVQFKPADGTHTFQVYDSAGRLVINVDSSNGILQTLDNTNLVANVVNPGTNANLTAGGVAFTAITSAGTQPSATQITNGGRVGPNGSGVGTNLLSPAPASTGRRSVVRASPVIGATNNPTVEVLSTTGDAQADLVVYGSIFAGPSFQDIGRGLVASVTITGNTTGITTTIVTIASIGSVTYKAGRAYRYSVEGLMLSTTADTYALYQVYKGTGVAGTVYRGQIRVPTVNATSTNTNVNFSLIFINDSGADITTDITLGMSMAAGTGQFSATAGTPAYINMEDVGLASAWSGTSMT